MRRTHRHTHDSETQTYDTFEPFNGICHQQKRGKKSNKIQAHLNDCEKAWNKNPFP